MLGVGPFQGGTIREQTKLAGSAIRFGQKSVTGSPAKFFDRPPVDYTAETRFQQGWPIFDDGGLSADMIGIPDAEIEAEIAEDAQADDDGTEIANSNDEQENLQR